MPVAVLDGLGAMGHGVTPVPAQRSWGPASIIRILEDGSVHAAADPRMSTASVSSD